MLEIEHLRPWVAEIRNPRQTALTGEFHRNQMHRMWRTGAHNHIDRMVPEVVLQKSDRLPNPENPGVRNEKIPPDLHCKPLQEGFFLRIDRVDLIASTLGSGLAAEQFPVDFIWLENPGFQHLRALGNVILQSAVHCQKFRILRGIDDTLPPLCRQVLGEFHPPLHARPP